MLSKQSASYQLNQTNWEEITHWYAQGDEQCKNYLVQGLALHSQIKMEDIHVHLTGPSSLELFNDMQQKAQATAKTFFMRRVQKNMPQIKEYSLPPEQWLELLRRFTKQDTSRLTAAFLIHHLSEIDPLLIQTITHRHQERPTRKVKQLHQDEKIPPQTKRQKHKHKHINFETTNCLLLQENAENQDLHPNLIQQGVRLTQLEPATPEKNYSDVCRTPGGRKAHKLWEHKSGEKELTFFKYKTPSPKKVKLTSTIQEVTKRIPKLRLFRNIEPIYFIATLEKLEQRDPTRRISQNQLTGISCQKFFAAYDPTIIIEGHSKYHWSHLIAHYFGGEQSIKNLIPATAASNYNILDVVEHFIAKKLLEENIAAINIRVEPRYDDDQDIPTKLVFSLTWEENNKRCAETIFINPRSHERLTSATLTSINFVREKLADFAVDTKTGSLSTKL